jgi:hypothetical protein
VEKKRARHQVHRACFGLADARGSRQLEYRRLRVQGGLLKCGYPRFAWWAKLWRWLSPCRDAMMPSERGVDQVGRVGVEAWRSVVPGSKQYTLKPRERASRRAGSVGMEAWSQRSPGQWGAVWRSGRPQGEGPSE